MNFKVGHFSSENQSTKCPWLEKCLIKILTTINIRRRGTVPKILFNVGVYKQTLNVHVLQTWHKNWNEMRDSQKNSSSNYPTLDTCCSERNSRCLLSRSRCVVKCKNVKHEISVKLRRDVQFIYIRDYHPFCKIFYALSVLEKSYFMFSLDFLKKPCLLVIFT